MSLGEPDGSRSERSQLISAALTKAGFKSPVTDHIRTEIWVKILGNVAFNPISALTRATLSQMVRDPEVVALVRSQEAARSVLRHGAQPLAGDLGRPRGLDEAFAAARGDALICLASLGFGHGPAIVAAAEEAGIKRAVFVSTTAVTTALHPPAKQVRLAAEQQIRGCGLDWTILRPTMIYGAAGDRNLSRLLLLLSRAAVLPVPATGTM